METYTKLAAVFAVVCMTPATSVVVPLPFVEIKDSEMPQFVYKAQIQKIAYSESAHAITIYHQIRKSFNISHKVMGDWLGVKRRSLYNWMSDPDSAIKYGEQIEYRLDTLSKLVEHIEPEHRQLLSKIAFSPIYGDPKFGESILSGESSDKLIGWYDKLFSQFESYRRTLKLKSNIV